MLHNSGKVLHDSHIYKAFSYFFTAYNNDYEKKQKVNVFVKDRTAVTKEDVVINFSNPQKVWNDLNVKS